MPPHRNLPSFLPSKCGAPALARVCGRFGRKRPFEIYRHLSTPTTIADSISEPRRRSGQRPRRAGIERLKLLSQLDFSHIFLPSRCRTGGVVESHHQDRSTRTSRRTIWRSQMDPKHSGRALHRRTVLTVHCGLGRCCVRSRRSQTASVSITSMKRSAPNPSGYKVQAELLVSASRDWSAL